MPTHSGYCSPLEVISDVTSLVGDEGFKEFSEGSYMGEVQQALTELAFDTYFDKKVLAFRLTSLVMPVPEGVFSIDTIEAFNGDECTPGNSAVIWSARNYTRIGRMQFKEQKGHQQSPIMEDVITASTKAALLYYNIVDGHFHFSDAVGAYENIMLRYRGIGCKLGDAPIVPNELRQAVKTYVALAQANKLFAKYKSQPYQQLLLNIEKMHFGRGGLDVGAWKQAQRRVQSISAKQRNDLSKYLSNLSLKII